MNQQALNVLFVHQAAELYGSDRVLLALVEWLARHGQVHPIVVVPCEGPLIAEFQRIGVEVHVRTLAKVQRSAFTPAGLVRFVRQVVGSVAELDSVVAGRPIAAVHSNTIAVVSGAVWSRMRRVRHVWHIHEIILRPRPVAKALAWLASRLSDKVACISEMVRQNLVAQCPRIASQAVVVPNGMVMPDRGIEPARSQWRNEQGMDAQVVVGLVGRINAWKGQGVLVKAAQRILAADPATPLRFVIVGSPPPGQDDLRSQLLLQISNAGLQSHVRVLDFTPDVWPVWCGMDIAVVPSTDPEPFGMVALEAMCARRPVVAAGHGGLADIVVDGHTGALVRPGNDADLAQAIQRLAADAELRQRQGEAGYERVRSHYSLDAQGRGFRRLYEPS